MDSTTEDANLTRFSKYLKSAGIRGDEKVGDFLRRRAAQGDVTAQGYLAHLARPEMRVNSALMSAAAARHPDWEVGEGSFWRSDGTEGDVNALVDWFQLNHATEAKRIETREGE